MKPADREQVLREAIDRWSHALPIDGADELTAAFDAFIESQPDTETLVAEDEAARDLAVTQRDEAEAECEALRAKVEQLRAALASAAEELDGAGLQVAASDAHQAVRQSGASA